MAASIQPVVTSERDRPRESWDDTSRGAVSWFTLFSRDITPTAGMTAGIAEIPPEPGPLGAHRHEQAELYYILEGRGVLTMDGVETVVSAGTAAFIPGDCEHSLRNTSTTVFEAALRVSDRQLRRGGLPLPHLMPSSVVCTACALWLQSWDPETSA